MHTDFTDLAEEASDVEGAVVQRRPPLTETLHDREASAATWPVNSLDFVKTLQSYFPIFRGSLFPRYVAPPSPSTCSYHQQYIHGCQRMYFGGGRRSKTLTLTTSWSTFHDKPTTAASVFTLSWIPCALDVIFNCSSGYGVFDTHIEHSPVLLISTQYIFFSCSMFHRVRLHRFCTRYYRCSLSQGYVSAELVRSRGL